MPTFVVSYTIHGQPIGSLENRPSQEAARKELRKNIDTVDFLFKKESEKSFKKESEKSKEPVNEARNNDDYDIIKSRLRAMNGKHKLTSTFIVDYNGDSESLCRNLTDEMSSEVLIRTEIFVAEITEDHYFKSGY